MFAHGTARALPKEVVPAVSEVFATRSVAMDRGVNICYRCLLGFCCATCGGHGCGVEVRVAAVPCTVDAAAGASVARE